MLTGCEGGVFIPDTSEGFKWRHSATPKYLGIREFAQLAIENGLKVFEAGLYQYAAMPTEEGHDLYYTHGDGWDGVPLSIGSLNNPAAGAAHSAATVTSGKRWLLVAINAQLVTDANVANRWVSLSVTDGAGHQLYKIGHDIAQTASTTVVHTFHPGAGTSGSVAAGVLSTGFGNAIELKNPFTVSIATAGLQATDDWAAAYYLYKEIPA